MVKRAAENYASAGVDMDKAEEGVRRLLEWVGKSLNLRKTIGSSRLDIGYFANVIKIAPNLGLALSTDGVGTKVLVAQMMKKFDTIGIDCIAMNVNDVICVGAEPISMLDYIAIEDPKPELLEEIGKGLYKGAELANVSIVGGEVSQIKEIIKGEKKGYGIDLVGMCVGIIALDKINIGQNVKENEVVIGLRSSGVHSNGLTLARNVFFAKNKFKADKYFPELRRTIGEELLEPTHIYVREIMEMLRKGVRIKSLSNITSDGLLNLARAKAKTGYVIDNLPEPHPVFNLIQKIANISDEEMFKVFNMGIGFCVVVPEKDADKVIRIAKKYRVAASRIGYTVKDPDKMVYIKQKNLIGRDNNFYKN
ncbi:MAG: phosphoribosylformylglycinamidine cyclo-ligase [Candidatus Schekmanbacteria bacterium RIFCSPHIGHO2_02_FULL_38_11]|uniref:Phosphoribosylformylglycinamidine cyclo-ligase n=1 Tax=Candidatus Schekmanbacteria bacterium RIFCSPLOWO2_12_FULL_38_15 TaxID=1817883 RepID=A0A1F7SIS6_9BACT|nr:MAG: phosphoribosylformylglycinamidine cyclo-ligase [Candidatus Schekmanbacteria bacterium GWA2_38_9]OGL49733.1 MAG: phosphoribosylformylglycinamidine cyclo-ligase [Candidatus Schekmanbacteria bacterium RIFCSPLOWO2_02_FULL_38_14]OGL53087.1 MAG: phosphoribosylformylglycinamidine cyclo-ligase [Candidatus Schekmanbacteria bacterium RIFCSPLOWO2_12_FULL_38_15]OGL53790.1 MAG: phosphoribosylformylglycinamidine cyclo-ligase [Candidatus Schekmanbacteria bacterium RIFCSPHIGHO2_02_FULL_38_11]